MNSVTLSRKKEIPKTSPAGENLTRSQKITREVISLAFIVLGVFSFKSVFIANYTVPTGSMIPNIMLDEKLIVNKMAYDLRVPFSSIRLVDIDKPKSGDVIVFDNPQDRSISFVKRLIGVPGDVIEVTDGFITINGKELKTSIQSELEMDRLFVMGGEYIEELNGKKYRVNVKRARRTFMTNTWTVPKDKYFVMGDNRFNSSDSRYWGFVPRDHIKGKAKFVYLSLDWRTGSTLPEVRKNRFLTFF